MFKQIDIPLWKKKYALGGDYEAKPSSEIARTLNLLGEGMTYSSLQFGICFGLLWVLQDPEAIKVMDRMKMDIEEIIALDEKKKTAEKPKS